MEEIPKETLGEIYIKLLDVVPEKIVDKYMSILSDEQINTIIKELNGADLHTVKQEVTDALKVRSDKNKEAALKPMTAMQKEDMRNTTVTLANLMVKIQNNVDQLIQAEAAAKKKDSPILRLFRRQSSSGKNLLGKFG